MGLLYVYNYLIIGSDDLYEWGEKINPRLNKVWIFSGVLIVSQKSICRFLALVEAKTLTFYGYFTCYKGLYNLFGLFKLSIFVLFYILFNYFCSKGLFI